MPVFAETLTDDGQELVKITTDKTQYTNDETVKIEVKGEKKILTNSYWINKRM